MNFYVWMHVQTYINFCRIIILVQNLKWQDIENKEQTYLHILVYINITTGHKA